MSYDRMPYRRWAIPKGKQKYFDKICEELKYRCPGMNDIDRGNAANDIADLLVKVYNAQEKKDE